MHRLLKRHVCSECGGSLVQARLVQTSHSSPDGRAWYAAWDNGGYKVGVVCSTHLS